MKKKVLLLVIAISILSTSFIIAIGTDDPLISESYLNNVFMQEIKDYIDAKNSSLKFNVVSVDKGKSLIGKSGCEIILRQGQAEILGAELGGLSDVTSAGDISSGSVMPANHLLIVPRDDGRGFKAITNVVVMIKGEYEIK